MLLHEVAPITYLEPFNEAYRLHMALLENGRVESKEADGVLEFFKNAIKGDRYTTFDIARDADRLARFTIQLALQPVDATSIQRSLQGSESGVDQVFRQTEITAGRGKLTRQIIPYGEKSAYENVSGFIVVHYAELGL